MISIGMDVGRENDPAALAVLRSGELRPDSHRPRWDLLSIGNIPLGTPYQRLADIAVGLGLEFEMAGYPTVLTIDATGIGAAVVELARTAAPSLLIVAVTIGAGRALTHSGAAEYTVGKHRLTECLQVAVQQHGLVVTDAAAGTPGAVAFAQQLGQFVRKPNGRGYEQHEAATGHDDLVLAAELGLWTGDAMFDQQAGVAP